MTYRPLRVQQDVGELQHQGVGRLVVRLLQGVGQQLRARRLDDHLTVTSSIGDTHTHKHGDTNTETHTRRHKHGDGRSHCVFINQKHIFHNTDEEVDESDRS